MLGILKQQFGLFILLFYLLNGLNTTIAVLALNSNKFRFKLNQLYEVSAGLELARGAPIAFLDYNQDLHTDVLVLTEDQRTLQLWGWNTVDAAFKHEEKADVTTDKKIANVIPGDFDRDGHLDLLVQFEPGRDKKIEMSLYRGDGTKFSLAEGDIPAALDSQPFAVDYSGTGHTALLGGMAWDHRDDSDKDKKTAWVWSYGDKTFDTAPFSSPSFANRTKETPESMCQPASPHSSGFVDLNGDCLADLFIVCSDNKGYEIWLNSAHGFVFGQAGALPKDAGPVSFADMNSDGSMDLVVPISGTSKIHILYNQQPPLCTGKKTGAEGCRKYHRICEAADEYGFVGSVDHAQIVDIGSGSEKLLDGSFVRIGDFNLDGYPDMAVVTDRQVRLIKSEKCSGGNGNSNSQCTVPLKDGRFLPHRQYRLVKDGVDVLAHLGKKPRDVAVFDIDGTGTLGLLVHYLDSAGHQRMSTIYNNFFTDAFFIKAQMELEAANGNGATFKYLLVTDTGTKHVAQSAQAPQTAYRALLTPYTVIGIGRTNNYIEDFSVGSTSQLGIHERSFEGLIPNSHVLVLPNNQSRDDWRIELHMNKSEATPYILATLLSSMVVLAITIAVLGALERKADNRERQQALHAINFDAL